MALSYFKKGKALLQNHGGKQRLVAIAASKGKIVGIGYNSYSRTHPYQRSLAIRVGEPKKEYLHAEVAALLRSRVVPDDLYVVRINRKGEFAYAAPCPICRLAISLINPRMRVFHT